MFLELSSANCPMYTWAWLSLCRDWLLDDTRSGTWGTPSHLGFSDDTPGNSSSVQMENSHRKKAMNWDSCSETFIVTRWLHWAQRWQCGCFCVFQFFIKSSAQSPADVSYASIWLSSTFSLCLKKEILLPNLKHWSITSKTVNRNWVCDLESRPLHIRWLGKPLQNSKVIPPPFIIWHQDITQSISALY